MRAPFIAGNWKMHKTSSEARVYAQEIQEKLQNTSVDTRVMIAPPFTAIESVASVLQGSDIVVGAQNMAGELSGAHTGEISAAMLKDVGAAAVIIGHSERRHIYHESNEQINQKLLLAQDQQLEVILCVGETLEERENNVMETVIHQQLTRALTSGVSLQNVTIAYEPVWAIGTGKTALPDDAEAVHALIRSIIQKEIDENAADSISIQYGGSVKPNNAAQLMAMPNIDGLLVGGASLQVETFLQILQYNT